MIGTLARHAEKDGYTTCHGDPGQGLGQLVTDKVLMYKPGRQGNARKCWDPRRCCARWGLERTRTGHRHPGLMGDAVDNIPGIPWGGEKTAMKPCSSMAAEGVLEHADEIKGKLGERVRNTPSRRMSRSWPIDPDRCPGTWPSTMRLHLDPPDRERILEVFSELEFRTLAKRVLGDEGTLQAVSTNGRAICSAAWTRKWRRWDLRTRHHRLGRTHLPPGRRSCVTGTPGRATGRRRPSA